MAKDKKKVSENVKNLEACFRSACNMVNAKGWGMGQDPVSLMWDAAASLLEVRYGIDSVAVNKAGKNYLLRVFLECAPLTVSGGTGNSERIVGISKEIYKEGIKEGILKPA